MITKEKPFIIAVADPRTNLSTLYEGGYATEEEANRAAKARVQGKHTWVVFKALRSFGPKQEIQEEEF